MTGLCVAGHPDGDERTAEPGSQACKGCRLATEQALRDLPQWWADLADPNHGKRPSQGGKSAERPEPISDDAASLRAAIRTSLVSWCLVLRDDRHITLPDEDEIIGFTQQLILDLQQARDGARYDGDRGRDQRYADDIADVREARASGADVIGALCLHITRHLPWLLASDHADLLVHQVTTLAHQARRAAHPSRPDGVISCPCGTRVALDVDRARIVCNGCGEWGDVGWWMDRVGKIPPRPMKITELSRWLHEHRDIEISTRQLRRWRDDGQLQAVTGDGAGSAQRFDPLAVALVVEQRLGHTARLSA